MPRYKFVERYDVKSMEGFILRNRVEFWLDEILKEIEVVNTPEYLNVLTDKVHYAVCFLSEVGLMSEKVSTKYFCMIENMSHRFDEVEREDK